MDHQFENIIRICIPDKIYCTLRASIETIKIYVIWFYLDTYINLLPAILAVFTKYSGVSAVHWGIIIRNLESIIHLLDGLRIRKKVICGLHDYKSETSSYKIIIDIINANVPKINIIIPIMNLSPVLIANKISVTYAEVIFDQAKLRSSRFNKRIFYKDLLNELSKYLNVEI